MPIELSTIRKVENNNEGQKRFKDLFESLQHGVTSKPGSLNSKKKEVFYHELYSLVKSGLDLKNAIELINDGNQNKNLKKIYDSIVEGLDEGKNLSSIMEEMRTFSSFEYYCVEIGEEIGQLPTILYDLAQYYKNKNKLSKQVKSALTYPTVVLLTAFLAVYFMMEFLIPMFSDIFGRYNTELPYLTKVIVNVSNSFSSYSLIFISVLISIALGISLFRSKPWFRKYSSSFLLHAPLVASFVRLNYQSRFCYTMALMLRSKADLMTAIQLTRKMIHFYPIEKALFDIEAGLEQGSSLHSKMKEHSVFSNKITHFVKIAEEVKMLDEAFSNLSNQFSSELDYRTGILSSLMEPILIVVLGLLVGTILVALYLPMFQISTMAF